MDTTRTRRALVLGVASAIGLTALAPPVGAHGDAAHGGKPNLEPVDKPFGRTGDPKRVTRTIRVSGDDSMRFTPARITVRQGDTIRFVVRNDGRTRHEMVLGTLADLKEHAEWMRKHPGMEHDEPFMAHVAPGKTGEIVWQFDKPGEFHFGCLVAGHFEAGMSGTISVQPRTGSVQPVAHTPGHGAGAEDELTPGEVRRIDKEQKKITLRHGEIKSLDLPAMSMVFNVRDPALLDRVAVGDQVRFRAEKVDGQLFVTSIEK